MDIAEIHEIRRHRLRTLVDLRFNGSPTELAASIGRSASQVSQWLSGVRAISDDSREFIEQACGLPPKWLNQTHQAEPLVLSQPGPWPFQLVSPQDWAALTERERGYIEGQVAEAIKHMSRSRGTGPKPEAA